MCDSICSNYLLQCSYKKSDPWYAQTISITLPLHKSQIWGLHGTTDPDPDPDADVALDLDLDLGPDPGLDIECVI